MKKEYLVIEALDLFNLFQPQAELIRHNENITYKITDAGKKYVLRIHSPVAGFSLDLFEAEDRSALIKSELTIIDALKSKADLHTQIPVRGKNGNFVQNFPDGTPISLLEWVDGETVDSIKITSEVIYEIGKITASMHKFFAEQSLRNKMYCRYNYDQTMLPQIALRICAAAKSGIISKEHSQIILSALDEMCERFNTLDGIHEKIIVHADLSKSNMILNANGSITPIDFSLCGYSHFYMDIGSLFGHIIKDEERKSIMEGYKAVLDIELNPYYIEPYFALQVILFIACQYERAKDWNWFEGAMERWCKDIFKPLIEKKIFLCA